MTDTPPPADPASPESAPTREPFRRQQRDDGSPSDRIRPPELPGEAPPETDSLRFPLLALALTSMIVSLLLAWMQADPSVPVAPRQPSAQERLQMPQWIDIPGGRLQQRDPPARFEVAPFRISRTEITVEQFRLFIKYTGYSNPAWTDFPCTGTSTDLSWDRPGYEQADTFPVVCVSARDAMAFAGWLSEQIGQPLRLPTELEWEYAARAGTATRFWWGDEYQERYAECFGCGPRPPQHPTYVGARAPNPFGLLDIAGNVREWTCTPFATRGAGSVGSCAPHFDEATNLVLRGGSWQEPQQALELVHRSPFGAWHRNVWTGFRLVAPAQPS
ncbi:Formylglycine-generating enzyme, required for sulfatase activity, contains SUMF1/FGE domain [Hydrocarboniphaga daqingensis]|uniref:Formylglycine-generating enzyme, required for sulfatase activity, contains SUMF1/FGE domain n=1 Tax=Hydrocarboniphaga daqingensis TaxID=490188 RepID=A0A1M5R5I9_9GAMM|nr:SUMF1/EgtB/PvdO family nonheme iron enzyme [Hydrocarboniphaga daqingensis]SHH21073.1 Formylglycine-generating enzyme, required for sulfatase activity, contains SUMF1/FGE domain [Hydrocarboniphaga daqingensis]